MCLFAKMTKCEGVKKRKQCAQSRAIHSLFCAVCKPAETAHSTAFANHLLFLVSRSENVLIIFPIIHLHPQLLLAKFCAVVDTITKATSICVKAKYTRSHYGFPLKNSSCQSVEWKSSTEHCRYSFPSCHYSSATFSYSFNFLRCDIVWSHDKVSATVRTQVLRAKVSSPLVCGR